MFTNGLFEADVARSQMFTSTSSRREMCTSSVSNVINHKFSHGAAFHTLSGKNVNVMLECIQVFSFYETLESKYFFLTRELSLLNTYVLGQIRILIHSGFRRRELIFRDLPSNNIN